MNTDTSHANFANRREFFIGDASARGAKAALSFDRMIRVHLCSSVVKLFLPAAPLHKR
jgi:hypothetical protein